jgi:hypothetical protein
LYFLRSKDEAVTKFKGLTSCVFLILFLNLIYYSFTLHILGMAAKLRTRFNRGVEIFRTDGGGEWIGKEFQQWLQNEGVVHHTTRPYTPEQNGVVERYNRTVMESARCMLYAKSVPLYLWTEAVHHANYVLNRTLMKGNIVTPYEAYFNMKPDVSNLFIFGSKAYYHVSKELRQKLDSKCKVGIVVGVCDTTKAFRIWDPEQKKIKISRDVCIDELANLTDVSSSAPADISSFEKFQETMLSTELFQQMSPANKQIEMLPRYTTNDSPTSDDNDKESSPATEAEKPAEIPHSTGPHTPVEVENSTLQNQSLFVRLLLFLLKRTQKLMELIQVFKYPYLPYVDLLEGGFQESFTAW